MYNRKLRFIYSSAKIFKTNLNHKKEKNLTLIFLVNFFSVSFCNHQFASSCFYYSLGLHITNFVLIKVFHIKTHGKKTNFAKETILLSIYADRYFKDN